MAEGRAKAARARAEHGSPHPKEPKWWPGSQPHLEGDGAAPAAEAAEEAAPEPEPAAAPEPEPAAAPAAEAAPAPAAEAPAPAAEAPAPAPAAAPAAVAAEATPTSLPPEQRPSGVTHGVPTGTRLRPEDAVQSESQLAGDQLMHERRRRIDEVVASSAEGATAATGPRSGQWLLFLVYILIVGGAIFLVTQNPPAAEEGGGEAAAEAEGEAGGGGISVVAENVAFNTATIDLPADEEAEIEFQNNDAPSVAHNIAIYEDDSAQKGLFQGEVIPGGESITYAVPPQKAGSYYFQCDVHPGMNGAVEVE